MIKSVEKHHLTHQLSFGTIPICNRAVKNLRLQKLFLGKDCGGTATSRKSRAMTSWVGLWRFENLKSGGLLELLTKA